MKSSPAKSGALPERTIVSLFARQAAAAPARPAVTSDDTTLTYAQLHRRSSDLARTLAAAGVSPGDRVGVGLPRGTELVVALLAVLKAGAAYVPLDPDYPAERLAFIAADTGIDVVVGNSATAVEGARVVDVASPAADDRPAPAEPAAGDVAYVIHTSGSTGRPKGVLVAHRTVVALLDATAAEFELSGSDVWTLFHSFAFDFSVWEMWVCLMTGGRLVVVPHWTARDPAEFHALLEREHVTVLNQTPSAFAPLLATPAFAGGGLSVRLLVFGGEPLDVRTLGPWFDRYPHARVENMYGITETTVHVTARTLTAADVALGSRSVGRPLPGWTVRLLDEHGTRVPAGQPGEIHVGGAGVALGYLDRPELTAERFLPDPEGPGTLYRSGDRGRELPDGELEHLGRLDDQVKIRGHRIELGEVRQALTDDPAVTAAAVVPRSSTGLDAYVVTTAPDGLAELRRRLATRMPAHLVPDTLTAVPALPLNANGKVDTTRLPAPAPPSGASGPGPHDDPLTKRIARLWEGLLGGPVAAGDNFFELGGNSLLAARLGNELAGAGLPAVSMRELYAHSSLTAMTELVRTKQEATP
ncbi:non-ribosomal peptide synthetase [Amycolatopsis sp. NPDC050768]|uniref:non-ribosomal peptide synthetase n=1 Tax=Amycolatopsis sp. NPDC050768 TaxID=3154839 RepID=UPI00340D8C14